MSEAAGRVMYTHGPEVAYVVERLPIGTVDLEVAADVLDLLSASYEHQFEHESTGRFRLPQGTITEHFRPGSTERQYGHWERMVSAMDQGSQYWALRTTGIDEGRIAALAKVSPTRPTGLTIYDSYTPECYINDVLTHPGLQRQGRGATVLHAALLGGGFDPEGSVTLDGYIGNMGPNRLFARIMGLRRQKGVHVPPLSLSAYDDRVTARMAQVRYATPEGLTLQGVMRRLETRKAWLRTAIPLPM